MPRKKKQKQRDQNRNTGWKGTCFDCQLEYGAEAFGANSAKHTDMYTICTARGHWLACLACAAAHAAWKDLPAADRVSKQRCEKCEVWKTRNYFDGNAPWCRVCEFLEQNESKRCNKCKKIKTLSSFPRRERTASGGEPKIRKFSACTDLSRVQGKGEHT